MKFEIIWHFSIQFVLLHVWIRRLQQEPRWKLHFVFCFLFFSPFFFIFLHSEDNLTICQLSIWYETKNKLNFWLLFSFVSLANSKNNKWLLSLLQRWKLRMKNKTFCQKQRNRTEVLSVISYHKLTFRDSLAIWIIQTTSNRIFHRRKLAMVGGWYRSGRRWSFSIDVHVLEHWIGTLRFGVEWLANIRFQGKHNVGCLFEWITRGTY